MKRERKRNKLITFNRISTRGRSVDDPADHQHFQLIALTLALTRQRADVIYFSLLQPRTQFPVNLIRSDLEL